MEAKGKRTNSIRNLEANLLNEREQHKSQIHILNALIQEKDASIREMKKELEERPTTELVDQMRQQLTVLLARISEKTSLLEAAEDKITELIEEVTDRENLITEIENEIEDTILELIEHYDEDSPEGKGLLSYYKNILEANASKVYEEPTSPPEPVAVPTIPTTKKLIFFDTKESSYDLDDLLCASAEVLGKGTFGTTYKIILESGLKLVVKKLREVNLDEREFREGIKRIGELEHENIMPLTAYYYSEDEKLLVYDFVPSLSETLHGNESSSRAPLNWTTRAHIALTSARGIAHIHSLSPFSSHGNIKSSNILLSQSYESLVSDTGLFFLASPIPSRIITGNRAPEVSDLTKPSQKADVYSFGVLLLELLTGKEPSQKVDLVRWVQSELSQDWDPKVLDEDLSGDETVPQEELFEFLQLAIDCTEPFPEMRPLMHVAEARIEAIMK